LEKVWPCGIGGYVKDVEVREPSRWLTNRKTISSKLHTKDAGAIPLTYSSVHRERGLVKKG
jgi:hypothetical protein